MNKELELILASEKLEPVDPIEQWWEDDFEMYFDSIVN